MAIANKCREATFSLKGGGGGGGGVAKSIKGVYPFNYLGRLLHRLDDDWPAVLRNILKARQVWDHLGKFLRR